MPQNYCLADKLCSNLSSEISFLALMKEAEILKFAENLKSVAVPALPVKNILSIEKHHEVDSVVADDTTGHSQELQVISKPRGRGRPKKILTQNSETKPDAVFEKKSAKKLIGKRMTAEPVHEIDTDLMEALTAPCTPVLLP